MAPEYPEPSGGPGFVGLLESARILGELAWMERSMYRVVGAWSAAEHDSGLVLTLADHARRHAWHSELLFDRLPELSNVDADALVRSPGPAHEAFVDALSSVGTTLDRLVGGYRVACPHLIASCRTFLGGIGPVSSPSTTRWVGVVISDLADQCTWGEQQIGHLAGSEEAAGHVRSSQARFEQILS